MALRDTNKTATATPAFEGEETAVAENTTTTETSQPDAAAAKAEAADVVKAAVEKSKAVVVASTNALANALRKTSPLDDSQNVIGIDMLESMGIGAFPRVTVDQGGFSENKNTFIGAWVKIELLSWNYVTLITTSEKDDKDADKLIRSSYDHVNVTGEGCTVDEYINMLRDKGYTKATSKKYIEMYANLLATAKGGAVAPEDVKMIQISVSPQSVSQWQRFLLESRMKQAKGMAIGTEFVIGSERKTLNSNTFGVMLFGHKIA